jgi:DNA repair ATPase RecN
MGSSLKEDKRSHSKLPMIGNVTGPGGSFLVVRKLLKINFKKREMEMETRISNQVSMLKMKEISFSLLAVNKRLYKVTRPLLEDAGVSQVFFFFKKKKGDNFYLIIELR